MNISKLVCIFLIIVHSICELILCPVLRLLSPGWIKNCLHSVFSSYGYFFYMPRSIYFCRTSFILVFSQRTVTANACGWTTLCAFKFLSFKNFLRTLEGHQAYSRKKAYFDNFFIFQVIISQSLFSFSFFSFNYIVLVSFCTQIFTRCEVAENDNCQQWLQNNRLFARKQLLELDLTEASKEKSLCAVYFIF